MGWWASPEDENTDPPPPFRRVEDEEEMTKEKEPNLFASIGRMMKDDAIKPSDDSSVGTAEYPEANDEATRRANEMANAMAWLTNPAVASASEEGEEPDAVADLYLDDGNWWESEFDEKTKKETKPKARKEEYRKAKAKADKEAKKKAEEKAKAENDLSSPSGDTDTTLNTPSSRKKTVKLDLSSPGDSVKRSTRSKKKKKSIRAEEKIKSPSSKKKLVSLDLNGLSSTSGDTDTTPSKAEKKAKKKAANEVATEQATESRVNTTFDDDRVMGKEILNPADSSDLLKWWSTRKDGKIKMEGNSDFESLESIKKIFEWGSANPDYKPPHHKEFDEEMKRAMKLKKVFAKYKVHSKEMTADEKCDKLQKSLKWLQESTTNYKDDIAEFEYNQGTFKKVNDLFGQWSTPSLDWDDHYDPRENPKDAEIRAKDLKESLNLVMNGAFDTNQPNYNCSVINRLKGLFADWKLKEDDGAKELEDALGWWKLKANKYDPLTASADETEMFFKSKKMLAMFGLKECDEWNKRNKEMEEALFCWNKHRGKPVDDLDESTAGKVKKVKDALLQIKRDNLDMSDMRYMAKEMDDVLSWYLDKGYKVKDLSEVDKTDKSTFMQAQGLVSLWGRMADPSNEQLKEIAESLIALRRNEYNPEIFDNPAKFDSKLDGDAGAKFQRLQKAMIDWRLKGAESDSITPEEGEALALGIENAVDWWVANGENFGIETSDREQIFMAQMVKSALDMWTDAEDAFTYEKSSNAVDEIKNVLALYRDTGKNFDVSSLKVKSSERASLLKLKDTMLEWRRGNITNISSQTEAEQTVNEMISAMNWWKKKGKDYDVFADRLETVPGMLFHREVTNALEEFHEAFGAPGQTLFKGLSRKEQKKVTKGLDESVSWWKRSGKMIDTTQAEEDFAMFGKARRLGQLWDYAKVEFRYVSLKAKKSNSLVVRPQQESLVLWNDSYVEINISKAADRPEVFNSRKDMKKAIGWWSANQLYKAPHHKKIDGDVKRAIKLGKALENYNARAVLPSNRRTKSIIGARKRLPRNSTFFMKDAREFDLNQATLEKVNIIFSHCTLPVVGGLNENYDPRDDREDATRRINDLRGSLGLVLSGAFDDDNPQYNCAVINRLKVLFAKWKLKHVEGVTELEDALKWWATHAPTYNPFTSSDEEDAMFMKSKKLISMFLKEGDSWNEKTQEVQDGLALWWKYKDTSAMNLDVTTRRSVRKVKSAMLQLNRDSLDIAGMKSISTEMNSILLWYLERGCSIEDLSSVDEQDSLKFQRTQDMLDTWGTQNGPSSKELDEIEDHLLCFQRKKFDHTLLDEQDDEDGTRFRVLEDAMLDWRLRQAESDAITPEEGETLSQTLENALDWWIANGDDFDAGTADMKHVFMAQIIKSVLDSWIGRKRDENFSFKLSKDAAIQMKEALALYRHKGCSFDILGLNLKSSKQRRLLKLKDAMLQWRRDTATNTFGTDTEHTIKDMMNGLEWWKEKGNEYDAVADRLKSIPSFIHNKEVQRSVHEFEKYSVFRDKVFLPGLSKKEEKKLKHTLDASQSALDALLNIDDTADDDSAENRDGAVGASGDLLDAFMTMGSELEVAEEEFDVAAGVGMDFRPEDSPDIITMMMQRQQYSLQPGKSTK